MLLLCLLKKKYNNLSNIRDFKVPKTLTFIAFKDCEVVSSKTLLVLFSFLFEAFIRGCVFMSLQYLIAF